MLRPRRHRDEVDIDGRSRLVGDAGAVGRMPVGQSVVRLPDERCSALVADRVVLAVWRHGVPRLGAAVGAGKRRGGGHGQRATGAHGCRH